MESDIDFSACGDHNQKIEKSKIIKNTVCVRKVADHKKHAIADHNGPVNISMQYISFFSLVLGKDTDTNQDISDSDQNCQEYT